MDKSQKLAVIIQDMRNNPGKYDEKQQSFIQQQSRALPEETKIKMATRPVVGDMPMPKDAFNFQYAQKPTTEGEAQDQWALKRQELPGRLLELKDEGVDPDVMRPYVLKFLEMDREMKDKLERLDANPKRLDAPLYLKQDVITVPREEKQKDPTFQRVI